MADNSQEAKAPLYRRAVRSVDRSLKYWALVPAALVLIVMTLYPVAQLFRMSFSEVIIGGTGIEWEWVGLAHLQTMLEDPVVPAAFRNTLIFVVVVVTVETFLGLVLAMLVSQTRRMATFYRTTLIFPLLVPPIAIGTMWRLMYDFNYGIINQILTFLNLPVQTWTADPKLALICIMIVDIWHWTSFVFLIMLAGVESLPQELYEAAAVDGASQLQIYRHVILPLLRPTIVVAVMMRAILAFKVFDEIYLLTGGGPDQPLR